ncbi:Uncharacterized protein Rs2_40037 [Raphanus sativus]|nr:Uncharacterized protein Rs2_40037 [Raphanus sativus]
MLEDATSGQEVGLPKRSKARTAGLFPNSLYGSLKIICQGKYVNVDPCNIECLKLVEEYNKSYGYVLATYWANDESVRKALQTKKESIGEWVRCNWDLPYTSDIISSVPYHKNNSINGYPSLIFSGDHDMEVPFLATQAWIRSLNYSLVDDWRPWMIEDQIAGEVGTHQSLNQRKSPSCFKDGSMANLCKIGEYPFTYKREETDADESSYTLEVMTAAAEKVEKEFAETKAVEEVNEDAETIYWRMQRP